MTTVAIDSPQARELLLQRPAERPLLLTGAVVVTQDPAVGVLSPGELLVRGTRIEGVGQVGTLPRSEDTLVLDAGGHLLSPGFVDTHRHAWEAQLRQLMPDVDDLGQYVTSTLVGIAPAYQPEDVHLGTRLAALTAIDSGITCMLDFAHNARSAAHSDAGVQALLDTGIRGVHASMRPHFGAWDGHWPKDLHRLREQFFRTDDQLLTLRLAALATDEIAGPEPAYGPQLAQVARELGIGVSVDAVFGASGSRAVLAWAEAGLLSPEVTLIHCNGLDQQAWRAMADTGTTVSTAPTSEAQIGLENAVPAVDEALAVGIRPGLSIDVEVALASDMSTQMRALLAIQRMRAVEGAYGTDRVPQRIGVQDVLDFATIEGARTNGLGEVTGSLRAGKQADLLVVDGRAVNTMPVNDPVGTLVLSVDARNVQGVLIAGTPRKWAGQLLGVDVRALEADVVASRDAVLRRAGRR
ncbi:amidohydrolase family protein [Kineococcus sp. SYSU DK006]|uniref:amidohydrolase family protein n=1 Tax=Kineococcus sp. SYSU DK006 TaxID=3383127 RepID=UPI003D7EB111